MAVKTSRILDHIDRNFICVSAVSSITSAARVMAEKKVDIILVEENDDLTGIVTSTDFLYKAVAQELDCSKTPINQIASHPLIFIDGNKSINDALKVMRKKNIRNVTVLENEKPVGHIRLEDIVKYFYSLSNKPVDPIAKFWSNYDCRDGQMSFVNMVDELLDDLKSHLKEDSLTAQAIARNASWDEISKCAEEEELYDLAQILELSKIG